MKRALVVEGGGMRGAHSAGVLAELSEHALPPVDVVCSSSAGSCTVAFWIAQQALRVERIWANYLHGARFIKYHRLFSSRPVMDLDYLVHDVFAKLEPLDIQAIRQSPIDFFVTATHCGTGNVHYFHNRQNIDLLEILKAGAAMPLVYNLPVWIHGEPYADGGIADSIPVQKALDAGCDELWVVLTQPKGFRKEKISRLSWPRWVFRKYPKLAEALLKRHILYNRQLDLVEQLERQGRAIVIRPQEALPVTRFSRNQLNLCTAIAQGRQDASSRMEELTSPVENSRIRP